MLGQKQVLFFLDGCLMKKKLIVIGNISSSTRVFRAELLESLVKTYSMWLIAQFTPEDLKFFTDMGVKCIDLPIDRRGKNLLKDTVLLMGYFRHIRAIQPNLVLTFTIKPNIYAGLVCRCLKIKYIATVEGLGTIFNTGTSFVNRCVQKLYGFGIRKAEVVYYLNDYIREVLLKLGVKEKQLRYTPGMGVNLEKFTPQPYPPEHPFRILTIGRIMKEKGIGEVLAVSDELIKQIPDLEWHICGAPEKGEEYWLDEMAKRPWIRYHGVLNDPRPIYAMVHVTVTASSHEGLSTVCIESGACGRPVIGSNIYGVKETINPGKTGFLFQPKNLKDFIEKIKNIIHLSTWERKKMGIKARYKIELEFDRKKVISIYSNLIDEVI